VADASPGEDVFKPSCSYHWSIFAPGETTGESVGWPAWTYHLVYQLELSLALEYDLRLVPRFERPFFYASPSAAPAKVDLTIGMCHVNGGWVNLVRMRKGTHLSVNILLPTLTVPKRRSLKSARQSSRINMSGVQELQVLS
jgi:hypothetical protein